MPANPEAASDQTSGLDRIVCRFEAAWRAVHENGSAADSARRQPPSRFRAAFRTSQSFRAPSVAPAHSAAGAPDWPLKRF
jgi:hypothetical protein